MKADETNQDSREATRFRTIFSGSVCHRGIFKKCRIHDLSASGAKLTAVEGLPDPTKVNLVIDRLGPYRPLKSEVIWRNKDWWGVRFTGDPEELAAIMAELMPGRWSLINKQ